jgi:hypothetical protein
MKMLIYHTDVRSLLRSAGVLLLASILVFKFMAPSASAFSSADHGHSKTANYQQSDCGMMMGTATNARDRTEEHSDQHENAAHCMPSMCCFHETPVAAQLVAVGLLLPNNRSIEHGTALSSHTTSTKDRPPKHLRLFARPRTHFAHAKL